MTTEETIVATAFGLWFAQGWYINTRLERVHKKLDLPLSCFNGLRQYLYEIDPQFDDERQSLAAVRQRDLYAGQEDMELLKRKEREGKRTLYTPFHDSTT